MKRIIRSALAAGAALFVAAPLALAPAAPTAAQEITAEQKAAFEKRVREYILENPEIIVEAMQVLERRQERDKRAADRALLSRLSDEILNDGFSYVGGNPDGDVTVVEFLDYRCGYCKQAHEGVQALIEADKNVRYVIKEFPILGPESTFAARAALAAHRMDEGKYAEFNDALMRHRGDLDQNAVMRIADSIGLDANRLAEELEEPEIAEQIRRTYALARNLEINGTPGFIIGDEIVRGYVPYDTLRELVETARERG